MNAFDISGLNQNALGGGVPVNLALVVPVVNYSSTWGTNIVFTDAGTYTSPDSFGKILIEVSDQHGNTQLGAITAAAGTATITNTVTQFNQTDYLTVKVTVESTLGVIVDGLVNVYSYNTTGKLANFATSFTTTAFSTPAITV